MRYKLDGWISDCKSVFRELLPKIFGSLSQFQEIQTGGWPREVLHMVKARTIKKWQLNTCDNFVNLGAQDFFVG